MTAFDKGFTLIEIMVAMAVLAIVLATLFKLQSSTIALSEAAHFKTLAQVLARQQMAALELSGYEPDELSKEFQDEYKGYTWSCEVKTGTDAGNFDEMLSEAQTEKLKKISLTIYSPGQLRSFSLKTWRYIDAE